MEKMLVSLRETDFYSLKATLLIFIFTASQKDIYSPNNSSFLVLEL